VSIIESNRRAELRGSRRARIRALICGVLAIGASTATDSRRASAAESYAIAMHGAPALPADFSHMPYVNPDAPKGGRLVQGILGTFDSLNPLIVRGLAVQQIRGFVVESLMARGYDEATPKHGSPTGNRYLPRTCCFHGPCCATRAVQIIVSTIPKS
jgi:peptide/nickel transport system substrate-binding protein